MITDNPWQYDTDATYDDTDLRPVNDIQKMTVTARAFVIGVELGRGRTMTSTEIAELVGIERHSAQELMKRASLNYHAPLFQDDDRRWKLVDNEEHE